MDKVGKIDPQPWMTAPQTRAVLAALTADDRPARFVGGCVRDAVIGREVKDIDIATSEPPQRVTALLKRAAIRVVPTGIDHGTVTAVTAAGHFEITTLRTDLETDGRHAQVAFTDDWEADAARRDFTMNALFCDADGSLYDPTGGLADLRAGRVRFVGHAQARIEEDFLRLLRFFRFFAWYGEPPPDDEALAACRALAPGLKGLSAERVWAELSRLLLAPDPAQGLDLMEAHGVLPQVLPEAAHIARMPSLLALEHRLNVPSDAIRRLAATLEIEPNAARDLADRLRLSRKDRKRLVDLTAHRGAISRTVSALDCRRLLYRLGTELFRDLVMIGWAADGEDWTTVWDIANDWQPVDFPVRGADVTAIGVPAGPAVGKLLGRVKKWWIDQDFVPDRDACLGRVEAEARTAANASPAPNDPL